MGLRVAFTTLGCKVNQSETDALTRQFAAIGYQCVPFDQIADIYVINTCTVTHVADKKSRQTLNQARRLNPDALIVATGCYASIVGAALETGNMLVIRNRDKDRVLMLVEGRLQRSVPDVSVYAELEKYIDTPIAQTRSRSMVKVQDGCDSHCTYCIIPRARGRSRSVPPEQVMRRIQALVHEGHAEAVITGVDLGSYGEDGEALPDLGGLLGRILNETDIQRLRVSSLEPGDFKLSWLALWQDSRLCRHLHVPLQAGSESVLQRMERSYTPQTFAGMIDDCRRSIPGITVTTDVMVGFPGETDKEFDDGLQFIRDMRFDGMHVFKYSPRSGTRAAHLPDQVNEEIKTERSKTLREEAAAGVARLHDHHHGQIMEVVWEDQHDDISRGLTDTNVRVYRPFTELAPGVTRVRLGASFRDGLWAEPVQVEIPLIPAR